MKSTDRISNKSISNKHQNLAKEFESQDSSIRFDYPSLNSKKRTHNLLHRLRNTTSQAKKLSENKQRLLTKPDHFADLLTGDQAKILHNKRNKARKHNINEVVSKHYKNFNYNKEKDMLQTYKYRHNEVNGIPTNGVTLPLKPDGVDRVKQN
jgi:hypothetical protein